MSLVEAPALSSAGLRLTSIEQVAAAVTVLDAAGAAETTKRLFGHVADAFIEYKPSNPNQIPPTFFLDAEDGECARQIQADLVFSSLAVMHDMDATPEARAAATVMVSALGIETPITYQ